MSVGGEVKGQISTNCLDDYDCKRAVRNLIRQEVGVLTDITYPEEVTAGIAALNAIVQTKTTLQQVRDMLTNDYLLGETSVTDLQNQITVLSNEIDSNFYTKTEIDSLNADIIATFAGYYTKTELDALLLNYYTKAEIDAMMPIMSNYYLKTEVDQLMPDMSNYYTKTEVDTNNYTKTEIDANHYTKAEVDTLIQNAVVGDVFNSADYYDKSYIDYRIDTLTTNVAYNKDLSYFLAYRAATYALMAKPIREYIYKVGGSDATYSQQDSTGNLFIIAPYSRFLFLYGNTNYCYPSPAGSWENTNYQKQFYMLQNEYGNGPNGGTQFGEPYINTHPQIKIDLSNINININASGVSIENSIYWKQNKVALASDNGMIGFDSDYFAWYLDLELEMLIETQTDVTGRINCFFVISESPIQNAFDNTWIVAQASNSQDNTWKTAAGGDVIDCSVRTISAWVTGKYLPYKLKTRSATFNLASHQVLYFALKFSQGGNYNIRIAYPKVTAKVMLIYKGQNPTGMDIFEADHNMTDRVEHA